MGKQRPLLSAVMAAAGLAGIYHGTIKPRMYSWGTRPYECSTALPGDEFTSPSVPRTTRALTIDAPREAVWPWLAQIGEGRGGFYSYDWLERAAGAGIHNADEIHEEWQTLRKGDSIWLARRFGARARQVVAAVEPSSHVVLVSPDDYKRLRRGEKARGTWAFALRDDGDGTRLLVRGSGGPVGNAAFDIAHFVMEEKMMRGIRDRAQDEDRRQGTPRASRHGAAMLSRNVGRSLVHR